MPTPSRRRHRTVRRAFEVALLVVSVGLLAAAVVLLSVPSPRVAVPLPRSRATTIPGPAASSTTLPGTTDATTSTTGAGGTAETVPADRAVAAGPIPPGVRIVIASIGVNAPVISLGLNSDGSLEVPTDFADAGWWSGGPFPGDPGPAVVVGHVSSVTGPGVFYDLGTLAPGDQVTVTKPTGWRASFTVTSSLVVPKDQFPTQLVYGPVPGAQLRLITCTGTFDASTGHFVDNLIVFADLASLTPGT